MCDFQICYDRCLEDPNRKMIKFFKNTHFRRIVGSVGYPLLAFWIYWKAFDGGYTETDILWGVVVTIILASAIYLYFPIAKRVEYGSIIWFFGLFAMICLLALGTVLQGLWTHWIIDIPVAEQAWGEYIMYFAIWTPIIDMIAKAQDKGQYKPREITSCEIFLCKGPAAWNKAERQVGRAF